MDQHKNSFTRRQFLGAMAAFGVTAVGTSLMSGCSSSRNGGSPQSASSSNAAQSSTAVSQAGSSSSAGAAPSSASAAVEAPSAVQAAGGALVAVFSWSGNTLSVANRVAEDLKTDLFRIEPATPYTTDYDEMLQICQDEQAAGTLPALAGNVQNWDSYSVIYLGFPTWWSHLPQIVKSFIAEHDCAGKVVYPFNTHGGSGFASCLSDLAEACPGADIREGLSLLGDNVREGTAQIDAWVAASA